MTKTEAVEFINKYADAWIAGKIADVDFIETVKAYVTESQNNPNKPQDLVCPDCGSKMVARSGQYGKFWGCSTYPKCRGTRDSEGKSKAERQAERPARVFETSTETEDLAQNTERVRITFNKN